MAATCHQVQGNLPGPTDETKLKRVTTPYLRFLFARNGTVAAISKRHSGGAEDTAPSLSRLGPLGVSPHSPRSRPCIYSSSTEQKPRPPQGSRAGPGAQPPESPQEAHSPVLPRPRRVNTHLGPAPGAHMLTEGRATALLPDSGGTTDPAAGPAPQCLTQELSQYLHPQ